MEGGATLLECCGPHPPHPSLPSSDMSHRLRNGGFRLSVCRRDYAFVAGFVNSLKCSATAFAATLAHERHRSAVSPSGEVINNDVTCIGAAFPSVGTARSSDV